MKRSELQVKYQVNQHGCILLYSEMKRPALSSTKTVVSPPIPPSFNSVYLPNNSLIIQWEPQFRNFQRNEK